MPTKPGHLGQRDKPSAKTFVFNGGTRSDRLNRRGLAIDFLEDLLRCHEIADRGVDASVNINVQ
jgi:hypothetical protein